jgi:hypothetical protein
VTTTTQRTRKDPGPRNQPEGPAPREGCGDWGGEAKKTNTQQHPTQPPFPLRERTRRENGPVVHEHRDAESGDHDRAIKVFNDARRLLRAPCATPSEPAPPRHLEGDPRTVILAPCAARRGRPGRSAHPTARAGRIGSSPRSPIPPRRAPRCSRPWSGPAPTVVDAGRTFGSAASASRGCVTTSDT